ncbi:MAG: DUF1289 domain-containing protein [Gammaproteobacteria bacterium]|jgi:hypothetical protein
MARFDPRPVTSDPLKSPCVRNCCLDDHDVCLGCGRTLAEIRAWSTYSASERDAACERAARRKARNGSGGFSRE